MKKWIELAAYYKQVRTLFSGIFLFLGHHRVLHGADGQREHAADGHV